MKLSGDGHRRSRSTRAAPFQHLLSLRRQPYSALMPANLITFAHFSVASERIAPNS